MGPRSSCSTSGLRKSLISHRQDGCREYLAAICQHLGLPALPLHDALSDATAAALIFLRLHQGGPLAYPKV